MANISGARSCVVWSNLGAHHTLQHLQKRVQRILAPSGDIEHCTARLLRWRGSCQQIRPHYIAHITKIARLLSIPKNGGRLPLQKSGDKFGNNGSIRAIRVLIRPVDVKIAQRNGLKTEDVRKVLRVVLSCQFLNPVGESGRGRTSSWVGMTDVSP